MLDFQELRPTHFEVISKLEAVETIAVGNKVRDIIRLREQFGKGRWRKMKGVAEVRLLNGNVRVAELHWYEARGIGRRKMKIKRFME